MQSYRSQKIHILSQPIAFYRRNPLVQSKRASPASFWWSPLATQSTRKCVHRIELQFVKQCAIVLCTLHSLFHVLPFGSFFRLPTTARLPYALPRPFLYFHLHVAKPNYPENERRGNDCARRVRDVINGTRWICEEVEFRKKVVICIAIKSIFVHSLMSFLYVTRLKICGDNQ